MVGKVSEFFGKTSAFLELRIFDWIKFFMQEMNVKNRFFALTKTAKVFPKSDAFTALESLVWLGIRSITTLIILQKPSE
ncbi:MAG: hypothetical protein LBT64_02435 [Puniceicoccales bacterium]|nr:hypothetical protein [Puniceicoccales bacterium]